jgi:Protein of unknown function (DUF3606)
MTAVIAIGAMRAMVFTRRYRMVDNPNLRNGQDPKRVNVHQEHEVRWWTQKWGVSREDLENAVQAVGTSVNKVEAYLNKKAASKPS